MGPRSTTKVVFLIYSIFIRLTWNLERIYISGQWIQPPIIIEVNMDQKFNIGQRSTTKEVFLKSSIFVSLTWNFKRICISGYWVQPPIIFEVNIGQKDNIGRLYKFVQFYPIDLKFEKDIYISGPWIQLANYFGGPHGPKGQRRPNF